jgi:hypothetical protein
MMASLGFMNHGELRNYSFPFEETVSQSRSWFESLTTNGLLDREFKYLPVRPELVEGLRANCDTVSDGGKLG